MDLTALVERAHGGDLDAFAELTHRFQHMAFGYALAHVRDFGVAQDVVQDAFVAAWFSLRRLETPAAFPGWLRSIVGHSAQRVLRRRVLILDAIGALPADLREVTTLYYVEDRSQAEIAGFLDLPVTTVNNRLHAARGQLKRRMLAMVKDALREHRLPDDFPARVGRIVRTRGPLVDAEFAPDALPEVLTSLTLGEGGRAVTVGVVQRFEDGRVRGVVTAADADVPRGVGSAPTRGARVVATGEPVRAPFGAETLTELVRELGERGAPSAVSRSPRAPSALRLRTPSVPALLETGIKVIDLLSPCAGGGTLGIVGEARVGTMVIVEELVRRLGGRDGAVSMFALLPAHAVAVSDWPRARAEGFGSGNAGSVQTFWLLGERDDAGPTTLSFDALDAMIVLSPALAAAGIYPAVDALRSRSRFLDPAIVGAEHADVAARVQSTLREARRLESVGDADRSADAGRPEDERRLLARARRLSRFFAQPFFIAEPYTKRPGTSVSRDETVRVCADILAGAYDDVPEQAFYFKGGLDEVLASARG